MVSVLMAYKKLNRKRSKFKIQKMLHIQKKYLANLVKDKLAISLKKALSNNKKSMIKNLKKHTGYSYQI